MQLLLQDFKNSSRVHQIKNPTHERLKFRLNAFKGEDRFVRTRVHTKRQRNLIKKKKMELTQHAHGELIRGLQGILDYALRHHPHVILAGDVVVLGGRQDLDRFFPGTIQEHHARLRVHQSGQVALLRHEHGVEDGELETVLQQTEKKEGD